MHLGKRLETIASLIPSHSTIVDVGCDHALLDIYLAKYKNVSCIASDISSKCIEKANRNIALYREENHIKTVVSDGLRFIDLEEIDIVVISGLGGLTILEILEGYDIPHLIIQANTDLPILREKMTRKGYVIQKEIILQENKIFYHVIQFEKGKREYSKMELYFGPFIQKEKKYIDYHMEKLEKMIPKITDENRKKEFQEQLEYLKSL